MRGRFWLPAAELEELVDDWVPVDVPPEGGVSASDWDMVPPAEEALCAFCMSGEEPASDALTSVTLIAWNWPESVGP